MIHTRLDLSAAVKLVSKVSDIQAQGGIPSFEHGELCVLTHHCFAIIQNCPCSLYYDPVLDRFKVLTVAKDGERLQEIGQLTNLQLSELDQKSGFFFYSSEGVRPQKSSDLVH